MERQKITVHALSWKERQDEIWSWCLDRDGKPCLVRFTDWQPTVKMVLPRNIDWAVSFGDLRKYLSKALGDHAPVDMHLEDKKKLYYYDKRKRCVMVAKFSSLEAANHCVNLLAKTKPGFILCDRHVPNYRKMLAARSLAICQWFSFEGTPAENFANVDEYVASWETIEPVPDSESQSWRSRPKILSFDIEAYSENDKTFPDAFNAACACFMISCIFQVLGKPETRQRFVVTLADSKDIPGVTVIKAKDEFVMMDLFCKLVQDLDPDVITGYNILGFDNAYMDARLSRRLRSWPNFGSRVRGEGPSLFAGVPWKSSAHGYTKNDTLEWEGRINIDVFPFVAREYKLTSYRLGEVGKKFVGRDKHPVEPKDIFAAYRLWLRNGPSALDAMTKVTKYCVEDAEITIDLFEKLKVWVAHVEMANAAGVPPADLYTRGQQLRGVSMVYAKCEEDGYVMDSPETSGGEKYKGAVVLKPVVGLHDLVETFDFRSLYPSIIIESNICWTTYVPPDSAIPDSDCIVREWKEEEVTKRYRWIKPSIRKGLLPSLVQSLIAKRRAVQALMKTSPPEDYDILNARQLALKILANGMYGLLGVGNGKLALEAGAQCVTARGREVIGEMRDYLLRKYNAEVVYGDTDSGMVKFPDVKNGPMAVEHGRAMAREITALFPDPLEVEFEKAGTMFIVTAKCYAYWLLDKNGEFLPIENPGALLIKGLAPARRDNCAWLRNTITTMVKEILQAHPIQKVLDTILYEVWRVANGRVPLADLVITCRLGSNYKLKNCPLRVFSDALNAKGKPMKPGDRLEYVVVCSDETLLGKKMRLVEDFVESDEKIDVLYCVSNMFQNPVDKIWSTGFPVETSALEEQHKIEDAEKILAEMSRTGFGLIVETCRNAANGDPVETVKLLSKSPAEKGVIKARRKYVSGRHIVDVRVGKKPARNLAKAMKAGCIGQAIELLASDELKGKMV